MTTLGRRLSFSVLGIVLLAIGVGIVVNTVDFAPDGVPLARRAEYEAKVAQINLRVNEQQAAFGTPHATAKVDEKRFDFGLMDPHTTASHQFIITNQGTADLFMESAGTTCKCTASEVDGRALKPGESSPVSITWNTGYQNEEYEQSALIKTNDPERRELTLTVRGRVRAELVLGIDELPMPATDSGKLATSSTYLYSQLWDDFRIESATSDLPGFQWSAEPLTNEELPVSDLAASSAWRLNVMVVGNQVGDYQGQVTLKVTPTSGGDTVERVLAVTGRIRSPIAFVDDALNSKTGLNLGLIPRGQEFTRSLIVRVRDQGDRQIEVLDVKPDKLRAAIEPTKQAGVYRLTLTVPADSAGEVFDRPDKHGYVQIGDPDDKGFHNWLPLYGAIVNPPTNRNR